MTAAQSMRVLHIIDGLGGGGSERWIWDIVRLADPQLAQHRVVTLYPDTGGFVYAERLRDSGAYRHRRHSVAVSDASWNTSRGVDAVRRAMSAVAGRRVHAFLRSVIVFRFAPGRLMLEALSFRPDIIHGHTFHGFTYGLFLKLTVRVPFVYTVPALFSQMSGPGFAWMPALYRRFHRLVDHFFTAYPQELLRIGIPESKISIIGGGVDLDATASALAATEHSRVECRRILAIDGDDLIALSVGQLDSSKGHEYVLRAMPALLDESPNLHWVVLGEGPGRNDLEAEARDLGVNSHVHLRGFVNDVLPWYAAADLYLRTPVFEGENLSSYQAMAVGLPVVGFDTGQPTELISEVGHGVLVPNRNAAALANAVSRVLKMPNRGRMIGKLGSAYAAANLDLRRAVSQFVSVYLRFD